MTSILVDLESPGNRRQCVWRLPCVLGRHEDDGGIADPHASRRHAELRWCGTSGAVKVVDLGSRNGIEIDGAVVASGIWARGAMMRIGETRLRWAPSESRRRAVDLGALVESIRDDMPASSLAPEDLAAQLRVKILGLAPDLAEDEVQEVLDEILEYGPISPLLRAPEVTEILVSGTREIWIEAGGRLQQTSRKFRSAASLRGVVDRILRQCGRTVDYRNPMADARLPDGSRVHVVLPPTALDGLQLTIRKFSPRVLSLADLVASGSISPEIRDTLQSAVLSRKNILISGGTGSGKTTLLGALAAVAPANERILTIEDAAEIRLPQPHVVRLEARPPGPEGEPAITIRDLLRNALRMRPDRIVIGECRGGEALDMLQAMNTGHDGSLTTLHANSPRDALARLETLALMAEAGLPHLAIREQIARAIDLIVQTARGADGRRTVVEVAATAGLDGGVPLLRTLHAPLARP